MKAVCLLILALAASTASAQTYPSKPIVLVVPFSPGGATDTIGRLLGERMGRALGQTILVENTTGAGGSIAVGKVARATPDGYMIGIGHLGTHVIIGATYQLQYDLLKDLEPLALVATNPQILVSKTAITAKDLKELLAWVKANGDKVSIGTGGAGTPAHVSAVYFKQLTGSEAQIIHYRGAAPAMTDLFGGVIDLYFDQTATAVPNARAGRVKAFAVTANKRVAAAPELPTVDEAGLPGLYMNVWHGMWAPKATPRAVVARINGAVVEALADPVVRQRLTDIAQEIPPREQQTPEALGAYHKAEIEKWWPLIKAANIKAE